MADNNPSEKRREGMTVQEIENLGKKYRFELVFLIYFILASLFSFVFFGASWSIYLAGLGGVIGIWLPEKVEKFGGSCFQFVFKQQKLTQIIIAAVGAAVSVFVPPLIFLFLGLMGGVGIFRVGARRG